MESTSTSSVITELSTETSFTFKVDDVTLAIDQKITFQNPEEAFRHQTSCKAKIDGFSHSGDATTQIISPEMNGFMNAIHCAYSTHRPLKLSVSDFIFMIGQGIAKHMELHAEDLRHQFVDFEGKEKIEIEKNRIGSDADEFWMSAVNEFGVEVKKRVKTNLYDIMVDDTSVATPLTRVASEISILDAFQHYFEYVIKLICGIPKITLVGKPEDWEKLRSKVTKLKELNKGDRLQLDWWLEKLVPLVNTIVDQAVSRNVDRAFWQKIYKWQEGGGIYNPVPNISGWVTVFNPYITDAKKVPVRSNLEDLLPRTLINGISLVPFTLIDMAGNKNPMLFYGGFLGAQILKDETVEPVYFYAAVDDDRTKSDEKE